MHVAKKAVSVFPPNQRFRPDNRLRSQPEFQRVFQGKRLGSREFVLYYRSAPIAKLGIIISKKNVKLATRRNRIKRVVREWYRLNDRPEQELIVIANRAADALTNAQILQCLDRLSVRANNSR